MIPNASHSARRSPALTRPAAEKSEAGPPEPAWAGGPGTELLEGLEALFADMAAITPDSTQLDLVAMFPVSSTLADQMAADWLAEVATALADPTQLHDDDMPGLEDATGLSAPPADSAETDGCNVPPLHLPPQPPPEEAPPGHRGTEGAGARGLSFAGFLRGVVAMSALASVGDAARAPGQAANDRRLLQGITQQFCEAGLTKVMVADRHDRAEYIDMVVLLLEGFRACMATPPSTADTLKLYTEIGFRKEASAEALKTEQVLKNADRAPDDRRKAIAGLVNQLGGRYSKPVGMREQEILRRFAAVATWNNMSFEMMTWLEGRNDIQRFIDDTSFAVAFMGSAHALDRLVRPDMLTTPFLGAHDKPVQVGNRLEGSNLFRITGPLMQSALSNSPEQAKNIQRTLFDGFAMATKNAAASTALVVSSGIWDRFALEPPIAFPENRGLLPHELRDRFINYYTHEGNQQGSNGRFAVLEVQFTKGFNATMVLPAQPELLSRAEEFAAANKDRVKLFMPQAKASSEPRDL